MTTCACCGKRVLIFVVTAGVKRCGKCWAALWERRQKR